MAQWWGAVPRQALAGQLRTTECILTSRTEDKTIHSRVEVLMGKHKTAIIIFILIILITIIINSIPPSLYLT